MIMLFRTLVATFLEHPYQSCWGCEGTPRIWELPLATRYSPKIYQSQWTKHPLLFHASSVLTLAFASISLLLESCVTGKSPDILSSPCLSGSYAGWVYGIIDFCWILLCILSSSSTPFSGVHRMLCSYPCRSYEEDSWTMAINGMRRFYMLIGTADLRTTFTCNRVKGNMIQTGQEEDLENVLEPMYLLHWFLGCDDHLSQCYTCVFRICHLLIDMPVWIFIRFIKILAS